MDYGIFLKLVVLGLDWICSELLRWGTTDAEIKVPLAGVQGYPSFLLF